jgi:hypothetical protein
MTIKTGKLSLGARMVLYVAIADELWYSVSNTGDRTTHWFHIGYVDQPDDPHIRLYCFVLPFISINLGCVRRSRITDTLE